MAGLFIVAVAGVYVAAALYILKRIRPLWAKAIALLLLSLIPTADAFYGRMKLRDLCAKEGGLKIYRTATGVEGFLSDSLAETILKKYPFNFVEKKVAGGYVRYTRSADGAIGVEKITVPQSLYEHRMQQADSRDAYGKLTFEVRIRATGEILGLVNDFRYAGGWIERLAAGSVAGRANAGNCRLPPYQQIDEQLIVLTLKPTN